MGSGIPTKEEIAALPRWARVAFAARYARRMFPFVFNSPLPQEQIKYVVQAIELAEEAAAVADARTADLRTAADAARSAAATGYAYISVAAAALAAARAADIAFTAAAVSKAPFATADDEDNRVDVAKDSIDTATIVAVRGDYEKLLRLAEKKNWNDRTAVPPSVFGAMWPNGAPKWANQTFYAETIPSGSVVFKPTVTQTPPSSLEFDIWIDPGQASKETLEQVFIALSELHMAAGGAGLHFRTDPDGDLVRVQELVPHE